MLTKTGLSISPESIRHAVKKKVKTVFLQRKSNWLPNIWISFKQLGTPLNRKSIPNEVIDTEGAVVSEPNTLIQIITSVHFTTLIAILNRPPLLIVHSPTFRTTKNTVYPFNCWNRTTYFWTPSKKPPGTWGSHINHPALIPVMRNYICQFSFSNNTPRLVFCTNPPHLETKPYKNLQTTEALHAIQSFVFKIFCKDVNSRLLSDWSETTASYQMSRPFLFGPSCCHLHYY